MTNKGILVVLSGFSGSGKGTLVKRLLEEYDNYALSISMTTRMPRPGEEHGKSYFFVTKEEFQSTIQRNGLLEYAQYCDNFYGTPKAYVEEQLANGKDVILEIEGQTTEGMTTTQARDLALLSGKYRITAVQPVDMFPHTQHVENVVRLELKPDQERGAAPAPAAPEAESEEL